jgi:hypothetical protein
LLDWARTICGSNNPVDAAPMTAALRVMTRRRVVMLVSCVCGGGMLIVLRLLTDPDLPYVRLEIFKP